MICAACGQENTDVARFCLACGAALADVPHATAREERKVVTVLFADLVGFTSRAEKLDPEDVRALLAPYHARLRSELEHFGGTVEKFIGDAVMALFGAPIAHGDDPERAVRAALAIRDWVREQEEELQVRIGVNTGEALVALDARPETGEGMASGDVVNTTARLQSAAPVNGILVGETTCRATRQAIEYAEHEPVEAKGKAEPIPVGGRAGTFTTGRRRRAVGRATGRSRRRAQRSSRCACARTTRALGAARDAGRRSRHREVAPGLRGHAGSVELVGSADVVPGPCLPYGEGVSFWALGEMVKAQAGVLETDSPEVVAAKIDESVDGLVDASEAGWVKRYLGVLAGSSEDGDGGTDREEAFAAWRRYLEGLAEQRPTVLVFEDLHWADDSLLDFE